VGINIYKCVYTRKYVDNLDNPCQTLRIHAVFTIPRLLSGGNNTGQFTHPSGYAKAKMDGKQCKKCRQIKFLPEFDRRLTRAQALARGYKADFPVAIESSLCKECQPKKRPLTALSTRELQNKVNTGEISTLEKQWILDERKKKSGMVMAMASRNRWLKQWDATLNALLQPMKEEIESVERQCRYARVSKKPHQVEFFEWYAQTLRQQKAKIELAYERNPRHVASAGWEDMIEGTVMPATRDAWGEIPLDERTRLKQPALVVYRAD